LVSVELDIRLSPSVWDRNIGNWCVVQTPEVRLLNTFAVGGLSLALWCGHFPFSSCPAGHSRVLYRYKMFMGVLPKISAYAIVH
jgi:hypothetical protein